LRASPEPDAGPVAAPRPETAGGAGEPTAWDGPRAQEAAGTAREAAATGGLRTHEVAGAAGKAAATGAPPGGPVYFIADAHLGIEAPEREEAKERDLVAFLSSIRGRAAVLYLVGDIFDFWFEFRAPSPPPNPAVLEALHGLSSTGVTVRFLGGNHDYWAGERLTSLTGASVHRGPVTDTHFGRRVFVAHGDGLPEGDLGYRILKSVIRSPVAISAFRLLPPSVGVAVARWASGLSEVTDERILRASPAMRRFLERTLKDGYDIALVGHIHRQSMWTSKDGTAVIVGDWMKHRSVVELRADGLRALTWRNGALVETDSVEGQPSARENAGGEGPR